MNSDARGRTGKALQEAREARGLTIKEAADRYGTPLYLFDLDCIRDRVQRFRDAFRGQSLGDRREVVFGLVEARSPVPPSFYDRRAVVVKGG